MQTKFHLDSKAAKTVGASAFINKSGAYVGAFTSARLYETKGGATMLALDFESCDGEAANIQMCLTDKSGKDTFQRAILDSLMTVFRLRELDAKQRKFVDRNGQEQKGYFFAEFEKKPVGLVLQLAPEEYLNAQGELKVANRINLLTPFDINTNQNAKEILENLPAEAVANKLKTLKDKELRKLPATAQQAAENFESAAGTGPAAGPEFANDDIPF